MRLEDLRLAGAGDFLFEDAISIIEARGEVTLLYIEDLIEGEPIIAKLPGNRSCQRGRKVRSTADRERMHLFNSDDGRTYRK